jgi:replicative DNA helicase
VPTHEPPPPRLAHLGDLLDDLAADAQALYDARQNGTLRGPITGLPKLDRAIGGVLQPGLHSLVAGPGTGKTALANQIAANCGFSSLYVSAEMGLLELLRRHIARVTGEFLGRLKSGEHPPEKALALARQTAEAIPYLALVDATRTPVSPDWIRDRALAVRGKGRHVLIVIDSLHSWAEGLADTRTSEYDVLNEALRALRGIAHELACPILFIVEQNRASASKGGLSSGAGTRKIEFGTESVFDLQAKDDELPDGSRLINLVLQKNRHGAPGSVHPLRFDGARQRFVEEL